VVFSGGGLQDGDLIKATAMIAIGAAQVVIGIWALVILCKCIGEVSRFSAWRGLGTILLAGLLIFGVMLATVIPLLFVVFISLA
ncbi:MAG: hypothetical protein AAF589_08750, partial [Planctomycetota bacterium]